MDIMIKLTVPNYIYRFYEDASRHVADRDTETLMTDALCAYAGLLNKQIARQQEQLFSEPDGQNPSPSRSR